MKISTILDQIDLGSMALPEFQRGYVWNREQVRGLMDSLYRRHPVGSLLVWVTRTENADFRGDGELPPGTVKLLLDGQQRITSLYGLIRGSAPRFFDGNENAFTGLYFNLDDEVFEFYAPMKMKDNPLWVDVTELFKVGSGVFIKSIMGVPELADRLTDYINRLNAVGGIHDIDLHIEEVTGEDKTVDVVVNLFNKVNSGGTKLSKGDLALAKICAQWPEARDELKCRLEKWRNAGFNFKLEWLLRCVNTLSTGEALFSALDGIDTATLATGLDRAEKHVDYLLNLISGRLGLDHDRVLGSRYSFPLLVRYVDQQGGDLPDYGERDKLLYFYIHSFLWGRYAGSTESVLNQDLSVIEDPNGALDRLVEQLRQDRGDLSLHQSDFLGWSKGTRFYPLLYMLTRVCKALDLNTGVELKSHMLGKLSGLQVHHIFPRKVLYDAGYTKSEANAIANFTFLTQETNLLISDRRPEDYLEEFAASQPGAVESHWIPMDRELWKIENYKEFLSQRRILLANAANDFLQSLLAGQMPEEAESSDILTVEPVSVPGGVESPEEEALIKSCGDWVVQNGLPEGEFMYELAHPETGEPLAVVDLAWPNGLQEELTQPVALLINEGQDTFEAVSKAGYRYFTNVEDLREYVGSEILG